MANKKKVTVQVKESVFEALLRIQKELKAPKARFNDFAKFNYRSCGDILEALKPLLGEFCLKLSDKIVMKGDRFYVKATVKLFNEKESIVNIAYARESLAKKGMDDSQVTGATSSYARKYALNGLFAIDDTADVDADKPAKVKTEKLLKTADMKAIAGILQNITNAKSRAELDKLGAKIKLQLDDKKLSPVQAKVLRTAWDSKATKLPKA